MNPQKTTTMASNIDRQQYTKLDTSDTNNKNTEVPTVEVPKYDDKWRITEVAVFTKFLVVCLFFGVMLLISSPEPPSVLLDSLSVPNFNMSSLSHSMVDLESTWDIILTIKNEESKWNGSYNGITCTLYNEEARGLRPLTETNVEPFDLSAGDEKRVGVYMKVHQKLYKKDLEFMSYALMVYVKSAFKTPRTAWVVGKSFSREFACTQLKMRFEGNKGTLMDDVPRMCEEREIESEIVSDEDHPNKYI